MITGKAPLEFRIQDSRGNQLWCNPDGTVRLRLIADKVVKDLGMIFWHPFKNSAGGTVERLVYAKFDDPKNIFRKFNAWSIPDEIVRRVEVLVIHTDDFSYRITANKALHHAKYKHFAQSGIERKIYVNLVHWSKRPYKSQTPKHHEQRSVH